MRTTSNRYQTPPHRFLGAPILSCVLETNFMNSHSLWQQTAGQMRFLYALIAFHYNVTKSNQTLKSQLSNLIWSILARLGYIIAPSLISFLQYSSHLMFFSHHHSFKSNHFHKCFFWLVAAFTFIHSLHHSLSLICITHLSIPSPNDWNTQVFFFCVFCTSFFVPCILCI